MPECAVTLPTLIVVSGPAGCGKTTLAHAIAPAIGCPAICRDEIKEGMVYGTSGFTPAPSDPLTQRTFGTFFDVLAVLLRAGVTVVAEAAFQDRAWRLGLDPLAELADIRIIHCKVDADVARARIVKRAQENANRAAHDDHGLLHAVDTGTNPLSSFVPVSLAVAAIEVDTTDGYEPGIADILAFINSRVR